MPEHRPKTFPNSGRVSHAPDSTIPWFVVIVLQSQMDQPLEDVLIGRESQVRRGGLVQGPGRDHSLQPKLIIQTPITKPFPMAVLRLRKRHIDDLQ